MPLKTNHTFALCGAVAGLAVGIGAMNIDWPNIAIAGSENALISTSADDLSLAFHEVAEMISPSVVTIRSVRQIEAPSNLHRNMPFFRFESPFGNSPFDEFFERLEPFQMPHQPFAQQGQGSGVIVSDDGFILTNSHVVADSDEVTVIFADNRTYTAEVVGSDPQTDLAVVRIDADGLQPAELGTSENLKTGEWVVAAGNPFGLSSTITAGIVSATGRSRVGVADYEDFIQTDAAINPGNSGGPLVNLDGQVVGINTAIFSRGGGNNGIGFAIPIDMARSVMDELMADGRVVRGYLGVFIQNLTEGIAGSFGYNSNRGALISDVKADSPAAAAGLQVGDIITHLNDDRIENASRLRLAVAELDPGEEVKLVVFRDGESETLQVTIGELPSDAKVAAMHGESADLNLGMTIESLTPTNARHLGLSGDVSGVVVTGVEPLGPAARAGIRTRDVITQVQGDSVSNMKEFRSKLQQHDLTDGVRLVVKTGDNTRFVFLQVRDK